MGVGVVVVVILVAVVVVVAAAAAAGGGVVVVVVVVVVAEIAVVAVVVVVVVVVAAVVAVVAIAVVAALAVASLLDKDSKITKVQRNNIQEALRGPPATLPFTENHANKHVNLVSGSTGPESWIYVTKRCDSVDHIGVCVWFPFWLDTLPTSYSPRPFGGRLVWC